MSILPPSVFLLNNIGSMNYFRELINEGPIKFLFCILSGLMTFFMPLVPVILITFGAIVFDAILGCKVARKLGKAIETRKLWKTLVKFFYCFAIIVFADLIDRHILVSFNAHLVEISAGIVAGVELWSAIENLNELDPTGPWRILSKFIKSKGERYLDITIDKEDLPKIKKLVKKMK